MQAFKNIITIWAVGCVIADFVLVCWALNARQLKLPHNEIGRAMLLSAMSTIFRSPRPHTGTWWFLQIGRVVTLVCAAIGFYYGWTLFALAECVLFVFSFAFLWMERKHPQAAARCNDALRQGYIQQYLAL